MIVKKFLIHKKSQWVRLFVIAAVLAAIFGFSLHSSSVQKVYLCVDIALVALILFVLLIDVKFKKWLSILLTVFTPILSFYLLEGYSHFALRDMKWQIQLLNIVFYALFYLLLAGVLGNFARAGVAVPLIAAFIGLANYYTVNFRHSPILPWDLLSIKTALSVTDNYDFTLPGNIMMIFLLFILLSVLSSKNRLKVRKPLKRILFSAGSAAAIVLCALGIQTDRGGEIFHLDDILFTPNVLYRNNGFVVSFTVNLQYLKVDKPAGYLDPERIATARKYEAEASDFAAAVSGDSDLDKDALPNIVVIMNESFSDLAEVTSFETNQDYMPFIHALQSGEVENVVSGDLYVSVLGGNTANTEYEFLTGNSMAFLPPGSIAYQQYISDRLPGMPWTLRSLGCYETLGMHSYYASGWDRDEVYPMIGFERTMFSEQMKSRPYFRRGAGMLRKYISDQAVTDLIIDEYASKSKDKKKFTFAVTMQNHGGYYDEFDNFRQEIELLNVEDDDHKFYTDMYLSLIKKSDDAFKNLIDYFQVYDEPVIVLMFGDHQPADYVLRSIYDTYQERSLEEQQKRYITPFVMWANFDIEDEKIDKISVNYLQTLLFEKAGLPLTGYQRYLSDLRETIPVLTANVLIDKDGVYYVQSKHHPYEDMLITYSDYQYNYVFDAKSRMNTFFGDYLSENE